MEKALLWLKRYSCTARHLLDNVEASNGGGTKLSFGEAVYTVTLYLRSIKKSGDKVIIIGNGGSAAMASETANRLWKFCRIRAMTFNDPVFLTCVANDYGWENVFAEPLKLYADEGDILIAISSSGRSADILKACHAAKDIRMPIITLSGFTPDNPLRGLGDINFHIFSDSYRHVERTHLFVLDCVVDMLIFGD